MDDVMKVANTCNMADNLAFKAVGRARDLVLCAGCAVDTVLSIQEHLSLHLPRGDLNA